MRKAFAITLVLAILAVLAYGGAWLWVRRPWRVVASVDGDTLTSHDLDVRVKAYYGDQYVTEEVRREMVRAWIVKQVLLGEAIQRSVSLSKNDEDEVNVILAAWLANQGTTVDRFFTEGPLPEEAKRNDFKEGLLVHALVKDGLRTASFQDFYRSIREKANVQCSEFPELERVDARAPLYVGLWGWRPARVSVAAAGQVVTSAELDLRVRNALDNLRRRGLAPPKGREASILPTLRRREAQCWIVKAVMRAEAARRGFVVTPDDEKEHMEQKARSLKSYKLTVGQFFKEGVLPEALKWDDFRSEIRVEKFTAREVREKISVTTQEIEARMAELRKRADEEAARGGKVTVRSDRKTAIDQLRNERFFKGFRNLFRSLFYSARVWSPEFPEMEHVDGVSEPLKEGNP